MIVFENWGGLHRIVAVGLLVMGEIMAEDDQLDESVWSLLLAEILERVLQRLPLEVLYRFRAVCKQWRSFDSLHKFCSELSHARSKNSYLLDVEQIGNLSSCPVYNPVTNSLSFLDLGFLESHFEHFSFERWSSYDDRWDNSEFKGVTGDGGLLCVSVRIHESEQDTIFVCNPLAKACNLLPVMEGNIWGLCLGLSIRIENYAHYRVFATKHGEIHGNRFEQGFYMYDSISANWKLLPKCPRFAHDSISGVFCNGVYYALYEDLSQDHDVLMSYDVDHDAWVGTGVVLTLQGFKKKLVVSENNRLFCVSSARDCSEKDIYLTIVEVNLFTSTTVKISVHEHVRLSEDGHYRRQHMGPLFRSVKPHGKLRPLQSLRNETRQNRQQFEQRLYMFNSIFASWKLLPKRPQFARDSPIRTRYFLNPAFNYWW